MRTSAVRLVPRSAGLQWGYFSQAWAQQFCRLAWTECCGHLAVESIDMLGIARSSAVQSTPVHS